MRRLFVSGVVFVLLGLWSTTVGAATLVVNTGADDTTPGNGLVSLREAVAAANADSTTDLGHTGSGADSIVFAPSVATIFLNLVGDRTAGPSALVINSVVTIDGGGSVSIYRQSGPLRLFRIGSSGILTLRGVTLIDGLALGGHGGTGATGGGGAAGLGGAIFNGGRLVLDQTSFLFNTAAGGRGGNGSATHSAGGGGGGSLYGGGGNGPATSFSTGGAGAGGAGLTGAGSSVAAGANPGGDGGAGGSGGTAGSAGATTAGGSAVGAGGGGGGAGISGGNGGRGGDGGFGGGGGAGGGGLNLSGDGGDAGFGGGGGGTGGGGIVAGSNGGSGGFGGGGGGGGRPSGSTPRVAGEGGFGAGAGGTLGGVSGQGGGGSGGGLGGAIFNHSGFIDIIGSCTISNNFAGGGVAGNNGATAGVGIGGGIFNYEGLLTGPSCSFSGNTANTGPNFFELPAPLGILTGAGGGGPHVQALAVAQGPQRPFAMPGPLGSFYAYDPVFSGGVRVAVGDINDDGVTDIITGAGPGAGPHVQVFSGATGARLPGFLGSFYAYNPTFSGGVFVAAGDINGDGVDDVITGAGPGAGPHVQVFSGATGANIAGPLGSFYAYDPVFSGGVSVAAGDVDGDGRADIITGAGPGAGPHVKVFSGATGAQLPGAIGSFYAYSVGFGGGVFVAAGDINHDGRADVVTGAGPGAGPHVQVFSGVTGVQLPGLIGSFYAYDPAFSGGVRVAVGDVDRDGRPDIITGAGPGAGPHVRVFNGVTGAQLAGSVGSFLAYDPALGNGIFVAGRLP